MDPLAGNESMQITHYPLAAEQRKTTIHEENRDRKIYGVTTETRD